MHALQQVVMMSPLTLSLAEEPRDQQTFGGHSTALFHPPLLAHMASYAACQLGSAGTAGAAANRQLELMVSSRPLLLPISCPPSSENSQEYRELRPHPGTQREQGLLGPGDLHLPAKGGGKLQAALRLQEPSPPGEHLINQHLLTPPATRPDQTHQQVRHWLDRHQAADGKAALYRSGLFP